MPSKLQRQRQLEEYERLTSAAARERQERLARQVKCDCYAPGGFHLPDCALEKSKLRRGVR